MKSDDFLIDQNVRATKNIYAESDDCHPARRVATAGDRLIVRARAAGAWDYQVSHYNAHPSDVFAVCRDEIEAE